MMRTRCQILLYCLYDVQTGKMRSHWLGRTGQGVNILQGGWAWPWGCQHAVCCFPLPSQLCSCSCLSFFCLLVASLWSFSFVAIDWNLYPGLDERKKIPASQNFLTEQLKNRMSYCVTPTPNSGGVWAKMLPPAKIWRWVLGTGFVP